MKVTFLEAVEAIEPLKKLLATKGVSVRVAYKLAKHVAELDKQLVPLLMLKDKIIKAFGTPDERGGISIKTQDMDEKELAEFSEQWEELNSTEVTVRRNAVPIDGDIVSDGLTALDMLRLLPFITVDDAEDEDESSD